MRFRQDVNGLRAIAVASVVLFHFRTPWIKGGFAGVDVFFVISGYLMTKIIITRLDDGRFSLWGFYQDRARRILPALIGLAAALLVFGFLLIEPMTYRQIGKHALSALTFVSNIVFYREAGYFDARSDHKWLLHTWSLSVEWQFYLLYPLFLMLVAGIRVLRAWRTPLLWGGFAISLALSIWAASSYPQAAFFLLPTRAWEMMAGGLVFVHAERLALRPRTAILSEVLGLVGIAISMFAFDGTSPWPSYRAVLPVLATCLVMVANRRDSVWAANPVVGLVGRWSYAIYIWHWPVVVAFIYFELGLNRLAMVATLAAVLVFGALLAQLAARSVAGLSSGDRLRWPAGIASFMAAALGAVIVIVGQGLPERTPGAAARLADYEAAATDWSYPEACAGLDRAGHLRPCRLGEPGPGGILVIGDSHAEMIYARADGKQTRGANTELLTFVTSNGCPPVTGVGRPLGGRPCPAFVDQAFDLADRGAFARVVISSLWAGYFDPAGPEDDLNATCFVAGDRCLYERDPTAFEKRVDEAFGRWGERLARLRSRGVDVVIVLPFPRLDQDLTLMLSKRAFAGRSTADLATIDREALLRRDAGMRTRLSALAARVGARIVDPVPHLCGPATCPTLDADGRPLYLDSNHFRAAAVRSDRFRFLDEVLGRTPS